MDLQDQLKNLFPEHVPNSNRRNHQMNLQKFGYKMIQ